MVIYSNEAIVICKAGHVRQERLGFLRGEAPPFDLKLSELKISVSGVRFPPWLLVKAQDFRESAPAKCSGADLRRGTEIDLRERLQNTKALRAAILPRHTIR